MDNAIAKVNATEFDGYPPETLLCSCPHTKRYRSASGQILWDIEYTVIFRNNDGKGWNHPFRHTGEFQLATLTGEEDGGRIYQSVDFRTLFQIA